MTALTVSQARGEFAELVNQVAYQGKRIVIRRRGKDVAAMVPVEDLELLRAMEDQMDLEAVREAMKEPGAIAWEKVKADLGL